MTSGTRVRIALAGISLIARTASGQQGSPVDARPGRTGSRSDATIHAAAVAIPVTLEGTLEEPFWTTADSIDDLRQREPAEAVPATERTVVRVARDADALYVAVRCYDSDPRRVRAGQLRRDADLSSDDNVQLLIDSFNDRRGAFLFATNPNGAVWDAEVFGVENLNPDWNGIWDVAVSRDRDGWTAEFRIPFLALRYKPGSRAAFGFNVRRFHPAQERRRPVALLRPSRPVSLGAFVNWRDFYGGRSTSVELQAAWRGSGHLIVSTDLARTTARLPVGAFTAVLSVNRVEYDFNPCTSFLALGQYDNEDERVDFNLRFHWIPVIGDDVYLVWNSGYSTYPGARYRFPDTRSLARPLDGAFVIKVVHRLVP